MSKKNKKITCLIDLDNILVDFVPYWLDEYNKLSGENVKEEDICEYELRKYVKYPDLLDSILNDSGFFLGPKPMPGALEYFDKLIKDERFEVIVVTQPPRNATSAVKDKREWMQTYFPHFDLTHMVFTHKKYLVRGKILFDDSPGHLEEWRACNPLGLTARITYNYNAFCKTDWVFMKKENAWREFYERCMRLVND